MILLQPSAGVGCSMASIANTIGCHGVCILYNGERTMTFKDYAENKGLLLLRDDLRFIDNLLANRSAAGRVVVLKEYCEIWLSCLPDQNAGRCAANTWLRNYVSSGG